MSDKQFWFVISIIFWLQLVFILTTFFAVLQALISFPITILALNLMLINGFLMAVHASIWLDQAFQRLKKRM